jgi:hypothetical protein
MKKQLLNIGKALSRAEQKQVFGGKRWLLKMVMVLVGLCVSLGSTMTSCSSWPG